MENVETLEGSVVEFCGDHVDFHKVEPSACDPNYQLNVEIAISNMMFKECSTRCVYDIHDPWNIAYWLLEEDASCWQQIKKDTDDEFQPCFGMSFSTTQSEMSFSATRASYLCSADDNGSMHAF